MTEKVLTEYRRIEGCTKPSLFYYLNYTVEGKERKGWYSIKQIEGFPECPSLSYNIIRERLIKLADNRGNYPTVKEIVTSPSDWEKPTKVESAHFQDFMLINKLFARNRKNV